MAVITSRLTSKGQATIPKAIREELGLRSGDRISFRIHSGRVEIKRISPINLEFARAQESGLAEEWLAAEDEAAYGDL